MSRDKQIEEMARELCCAKICHKKARENCIGIGDCPKSREVAESLYNAGYRKAEDVAREIIGVLDDLYPKINDILKERLKDYSPSYTRDSIFALVDILHRKSVEKIKKKYESET